MTYTILCTATHVYICSCTVQMEGSTYSDSILCEAMPDIAMATASMDQISLSDYVSPAAPRLAGPEMELDLGDGTSHNSGSRGSTVDRKSQCGTLYI